MCLVLGYLLVDLVVILITLRNLLLLFSCKGVVGVGGLGIEFGD